MDEQKQSYEKDLDDLRSKLRKQRTADTLTSNQEVRPSSREGTSRVRGRYPVDHPHRRGSGATMARETRATTDAARTLADGQEQRIGTNESDLRRERKQGSFAPFIPPVSTSSTVATRHRRTGRIQATNRSLRRTSKHPTFLVYSRMNLFFRWRNCKNA